MVQQLFALTYHHNKRYVLGTAKLRGFRIFTQEMFSTNNVNKLQNLFVIFYAEHRTLQLNHRLNFYQIIATINSSTLHIKLILSNSRLWKPLLKGILFNILNSNEILVELWKTFVTISYFWKKRHVTYMLIKYRLILRKTIMHMINQYWLQKKRILSEMYYCRDDTNWLFDESIQMKLSSKLLTHIAEFDKVNIMRRRSVTFDNLMIESLENIQSKIVVRSNMDKCKEFYYQQMRLIFCDIGTRMHIKLPSGPRKKCGWIKCQTSTCLDITCRKSTTKLVKCKGCKLVYYCCRKHQKLDWKAVHRAQCLFSKHK
eukprot:440037_1